MTRHDWMLMAVVGLICAAVAIILGPLTGDMP